MFSHKVTARMVGVLYVIGTVAGVLSVMFIGPALNAPQRLADSGNQLRFGALAILTMGLALALIPVVVFPIARKHHESLAIGYVLFRGALETITYLLIVIGWLFVLTLSEAYAQFGASILPFGERVITIILDGAIMSTVITFVFISGALMFYTLRKAVLE